MNLNAATYCRARSQTGVSLIEALVALLVLSLGLLSVSRIQASLRLNTDVSRQRNEAVRLAQNDLERLKAFTAITSEESSASNSAAYADISSHHSVAHHAHTQFTIARNISENTSAPFKSATVRVSWPDRSGTTQEVMLSSHIAGTLPAYSAALTLAPQGSSVALPMKRALSIPFYAKDLGDQRSALKPVSHSNHVLIMSNVTGQVISICRNVAATSTPRELAASELGTCETFTGNLLTGYIRFALGNEPAALNANDTPLPLEVSAALKAAGANPLHCYSEAQKTVSYTLSDRTYTESVPLHANPISLGAAHWVEHGERFIAYSCVMPTSTQIVSGPIDITITPLGWAWGQNTDNYNACQYHTAQDPPSTDQNAKRPPQDAAQLSKLHSQNYLIIRGNLSCPSGTRPHSDNTGSLA